MERTAATPKSAAPTPIDIICLEDLDDVQELIKTLALPRDFADRLNPFVRKKSLDLWNGVQADPNPHDY